jgi:hypothetical protein
MTIVTKDDVRGGIVRPVLMVAMLVLTIVPAWPAAASPRPEHYESVAPSNTKEARTVLAECVQGITEAFRVRDYETIHKITYTAEKAAAVLANDAESDPGLSERLAHLIEVVHQASEIPSEGILAVAVPQLGDASRNVLTPKS